jgi:hydroxymethylbilane synthase
VPGGKFGKQNKRVRCMPVTLIIATRQSRLALWQAQHVSSLLTQRFDWQVQLLSMTTLGDQILDRSLAEVGGKGLFIKELEAALQHGQAHLAVHSLKDVPMQLPPGFELAAVLEREDSRDAFVSNQFADWADLPQGARVGTSSLRRVVQLKALRPDLNVLPLRGNLDTRLRKLDDGHFEAIVLATAGLVRLGLRSRIRSHFEPEHMLPCAGQGALGLEVRTDARALREQLQQLTHRPTWLAVHAERALSKALSGSCSVPLAAHATWQGNQLQLRAALGHAQNPRAPLLWVTEHGSATTDQEASLLGERAAAQLRHAGAEAYLAAASVGPATP